MVVLNRAVASWWRLAWMKFPLLAPLQLYWKKYRKLDVVHSRRNSHFLSHLFYFVSIRSNFKNDNLAIWPILKKIGVQSRIVIVMLSVNKTFLNSDFSTLCYINRIAFITHENSIFQFTTRSQCLKNPQKVSFNNISRAKRATFISKDT